MDLDYAQRLRTRQHEIDLTKLNDSEESRQWRAELERESAAAQARRAESLRQIEHDRELAHTSTTDRREDEWQETLHTQRLDRVQGEITLAQSDRVQRVDLVEIEMRKSRELTELDLQRRKAELEREINNNASNDQLDRLKEIQVLNQDAEKDHHERRLMAQRQQIELETMKEDRQSEQALKRIQAMRGMSAVELMAHSPNAAIIADALKHKSSQQAAVETARAQAAAMQATSTKHEELYQKLNETERQSADRVIAAMKEAMQGQQATFNQFVSIIEGVTRNLASQPGSTVVVSGGTVAGVPHSGTAGPTPQRTLVCGSCRTENGEADRHCRQCGKPL